MQPLMMLLLFGLVLSNKPANVPWAVLDRSQSPLSRRLVQEVYATGYFLSPRSVSSYGDARALLRTEEVLAVLVVPDDLVTAATRGRARVQLLLDGSDPLSAARVGGYIGQVAAATDTGRHVGAPAAPSGVAVRQRFWFNPTLSDRNFFLGALAGLLLTNICLSATALGLVGERESGTFEQMLALPTTSIEIVLGKLVPYVVVCYGLMLIGTGASGLVFGVWPAGSMLSLIIVTLPFVLSSLAIGVFVSALAKTSAQAIFIAVFFILPSFVLSGSMFPYQLMPAGVREIGALFPLRWYQIALRRIIERGAGLSDVLVPMLALVGLYAVLLAAIRWRMKPRLG
jgi:ABC-2 type transport system permease protein